MSAVCVLRMASVAPFSSCKMQLHSVPVTLSRRSLQSCRCHAERPSHSGAQTGLRLYDGPFKLHFTSTQLLS